MMGSAAGRLYTTKDPGYDKRARDNGILLN